MSGSLRRSFARSSSESVAARRSASVVFPVPGAPVTTTSRGRLPTPPRPRRRPPCSLPPPTPPAGAPPRPPPPPPRPPGPGPGPSSPGRPRPAPPAAAASPAPAARAAARALLRRDRGGCARLRLARRRRRRQGREGGRRERGDRSPGPPVETVELAEDRAGLLVLRIDDVAGLLAVLLGAHDATLDRTADVGLEVVALDARQELGEECRVHPVDTFALGLRRRDEVEEVDDRGGGLSRVHDERMVLDEPAHRDLTALAVDLLRRDGAALLGDVEERFEQKPPLRAPASEAARLVGPRERIEESLYRRDPPGVPARHRVDAAQDAHEVEERLGDERRRHVRREQLLCLGAGSPLGLREDRSLFDARVDTLLEDARGLLLRERNDRVDEVRARHGPGVERHELIEEEHREAALLLLRLGRGRRDHRGDVRLRAAGADSRAHAARAPLLDGRLVGLRVVGAQPAGTRPARLGDEVLEQVDAVAEVWRVAELVRDWLVARDEVDLLVLVLDRFADCVEVAVAGHDEPDLEVRPLLVQELEGARDEDGVRPSLEEPAAHALRDRDGFHPGELEGHKEGLVLRGDLLAEDGELHPDRAEFGGLLQDRLEDRERRGQRARGVLAKRVVDVLPVN